MKTRNYVPAQRGDEHVAVSLRAAFGISTIADLTEVVTRFKEFRRGSVVPADGLIALEKMIADLHLKSGRQKPNRRVWPISIVRELIYGCLDPYSAVNPWQIIKSIALDNPGWVPKEDVGLTLLYMDLDGEIDIDSDGVWGADECWPRGRDCVPADSSIH